MNLNLDSATAQRLQEFVAKLKSQTPQTELLLQVRHWPNKENRDHDFILKAANEAFQFDVEAQGEELDAVLSQLEESFSDEVRQRKALLFMLAEGVDSQSPVYSKYLH